jgi:hypothetical protein
VEAAQCRACVFFHLGAGTYGWYSHLNVRIGRSWKVAAVTIFDKYPRAAVLPLLYPVSAVDVGILEERRSVPDALKTFWLESGSGLFNEGLDGTTLLRGVVNNLLGPDEILSVLDAGCGDDFEGGLPFFEMNDCIHLLIGTSGEIFAGDTGKVVAIAASLDEFVARLMLNPGFYVPLLGED